MSKRIVFLFFALSFLSLHSPVYATDPVIASTMTPVLVSSISAPVIATPVLLSSAAAFLTVLHPQEGQRLPPLTQVFAYGGVSPGSTLTLNGFPVSVHPKGGYLTMVALTPGENTIHADVRSLDGGHTLLDRHVFVSSGFIPSPVTPLTLERGSLSPNEDLWLAGGDILHVSFQGSPGATASFAISGIKGKFPMQEVNAGSATARGLYQGSYLVQPTDHLSMENAIEVELKKGAQLLHQKTAAHLTLDSTAVPRMAQVIDDVAAVRTAAEGGYDFFIYKGMKVRLSGFMDGQWRIRFSAAQSGWVKQSALSELPPGTSPNFSFLTNFNMSHLSEDTAIRIPLSEMLPWHAEQSLDPMLLTVTLFGAADRTNLIRYDPSDPLIRLVQWKQVGSDAVQILIQPKFKTWWGYDIHYEGSTLVIQIRSPWKSKDLKGMVIAVDPGHGGSDSGATGALGTLEKDTNLAIAKVVKDALEKAGARPFLTRDRDMDVALLDRGRMAWKAGARLFISIHGNASGVEENPLWNNGYSVYFYHPQSSALAHAVHAQYGQQLENVPDHGLYYDDLSVCRTTQMPAILTEQAFLIIPEQEQLLLDPHFHRAIAAAITNGIKDWLVQ